jgi:hypothetical protein
MGTCYILFLTAVYVDNGKSLPLGRELSPMAFWLLPSVIGIPVVVNALLRHALARHANDSGYRTRRAGG